MNKLHPVSETKEELLNDQLGGTLQTEKAEPLFQTTPVDGTPFNIIEREQKHFVTFGNYKISIDYDTHEQAERLIREYDYYFLINVMFAALEHFSNNAETINQLRNNQNQQQ